MFCWTAAVWYNLGHLWQKKEVIPLGRFCYKRCTNFLHGGNSTIFGKILNKFIKENLYFFWKSKIFQNLPNCCNACSKIHQRKSLDFFVRGSPSCGVCPGLTDFRITSRTKKFFGRRKNSSILLIFLTHL